MGSDPSAAAEGCAYECDECFCYETEYLIRYEPIRCLEQPLKCQKARSWLRNLGLFVDELLRGMGDPNWWYDQHV